MNDRDLVSILDKHRHDILNHIQLVHGYLSMDRPEMAKEKLNDWIEICEQGRRLSSLRIPKFTIWTVRFDLLYNRLRLYYEIDSNINLSVHDMEIYRLSKEFAEALIISGSAEVLHEVELTVKNDDENVCFEFRAEGPFEFAERFGCGPESEFEIDYKATKEEIRYEFIIPYQS